MANEVVLKLRMDGESLIVSGLGKVNTGLSTMGSSAINAGEKVNAGMSAASRGVQSISTQLGKLQSYAAGYIGFQALASLAKQSFDASLSMERMSRTIEFASGNANDFSANTSYLRSKVGELGLELVSAGTAFAKLGAASKNTALEGAGTRSIFDAVAKASTVMGLSADDTAGSLLAIGQMISKGTVSSEELRGQLGERLPGAFQIASRAMGVTTQELGKLLEQGKITTDVFLPRFAAQMRTEMAGSVEAASDSVQANLNRVKSSWTQLMVTINNSNQANETIKGFDVGLTAITKALDSNKAAWPGWADTVAMSVAIAAEGINLVSASVRGVAREMQGVYNTAENYLRRQAALVADSQLNGGKNADTIKAQFDAEQKALDDGYNKDVANIYGGLNKYTEAVKAEIAARKDRANRLALDGRARSAIRAGDGVQAFEDAELLRTNAKITANADASKAAAKAVSDAQKEAHRILLANASEHTKMVDAAIAEDEKAHKLTNDQIRSASTMAEQIEFETRLLGLNAEQRAIASAERELERQGIVAGTLAYDAYIDRIKTASAAKATTQAGIDAADKLADANKKAAEESGKYWEDALMRAFESGKGFFESLWDTIKNTLKTQVLKVSVQGVMGALGVGASGAAMAGGASGGLSVSSVLGDMATKYGIESTLTSAFPGVTSVVTTFGNSALAGIQSMIGMTGTAAQAATAAANGIAAGAQLAAGQAATGSAAASAGASLASAVPYVAAALVIANALGLFKQTSRTDGGVSATLASSSSLQTYDVMRTDGSLFSGPSYRDRYNAVDTVASKALSDQVALIKTGAIEAGKGLGLVANDISNFTTSLNFRTNGLSAEAIQAKIDAGIAAFAEGAITAAYGSALDAYKREGETASTTLARLSTSLTTANQWLNQFHDTLLSTSVAAADQASKLIDAFGSAEAFTTAQSTYYQAMYTEAERLANTTVNVAKSLALINVAMPTTLEAYNKLRNEQDLMTEAGRNAYTVMTMLGPEFAQVASAAQAAADASIKLVTDVFDALEKRLTSLIDSIASERESVASARDSILNAAPKTYTQLDADITAAKVALPSDAGVVAANAALTSADSTVSVTSKNLALMEDLKVKSDAFSTARVRTAQEEAARLTTLAKSLSSQFSAAVAPYGTTWSSDGVHEAFKYNATTNQVSDWQNASWSSAAAKRAAMLAVRGSNYYTSGTSAESLVGQIGGEGGAVAINVRLTASTRAVTDAVQQGATEAATYQASIDKLNETLKGATATQTSAAAAVKTSLLAYADAMTQYSGDAEKAVKVLSKLREETVAYYEAQKALASTMATSSASLRSAVAALSTSQLDPMAATLQKQREFAQSYAMALSTSGADKAGYADKMTAALPALSEALKATSTLRDWSIQSAQLAAQSSTIAAQLDSASAAMNYEAESLGLLGSIDLALNELDTNTAILKNAIDSGTATSAAGLRAIVTQLGGVPAFAGGGYHSGGIRLVGEHGPELEVTGPSRIFNASQIRGFGGQSDNAEIVAELRAIRKENAELRAELRAITIHTSNTADATRRMDKNGVLVYTDPAEPLKTQVAA